jgi:hypothetical protein
VGAQCRPDALGTIHTSRKGFYRLLERHVRELGPSDGQSAASSAVRRLQLLDDYRPPSLERWVAGDDLPVTTVHDGGSIHRLSGDMIAV